MVAALLFAGCDSFSVIDQFSASLSSPTPTPAPTPGPGGLTLGIQTPTLQQNETTLLVPSGGTPPYTYTVLNNQTLSYPGTYGTVNAATPEYTAGTSIGTLTIRVIDNPGNHYDATVTVIPPTPTDFQVVFASSNKGNLSWTYPNTEFITGFEVWVSTNSGVSYSLKATLGYAATVYTHNGAANTNLYRLYAVSGAYKSLAAEAP